MDYTQDRDYILDKMYEYMSKYRIKKFKLTLRQVNLIEGKYRTTFPAGLLFCGIRIEEAKEKETK